MDLSVFPLVIHRQVRLVCVPARKKKGGTDRYGAEMERVSFFINNAWICWGINGTDVQRHESEGYGLTAGLK